MALVSLKDCLLLKSIPIIDIPIMFGSSPHHVRHGKCGRCCPAGGLAAFKMLVYRRPAYDATRQILGNNLSNSHEAPI